MKVGMVLLRMALALAGSCMILAAMGPVLGNVVGGGTGTGANVTLVDNGTTVTLSNGIVTAVVNKASATCASLKLGTFENVDQEDSGHTIYFSLDGGTTYQNPANCVYTITQQTATMVDISCKHFAVTSGTTPDPHMLDIDIHFVMRTGAHGLYMYAVLSHPAAYPATTWGEWRMAWFPPRNGNLYAFENYYVDSLRHGQGPSYYDMEQGTVQGIKEITLLNTGVLAGQMWCKYDFNANYYGLNTWGHASNVSGHGGFLVLASHEYFNDGPTHQDLTIAESYTLQHFGMDHYGGSTTSVAAGETWSKIFGPWLIYCNTGATADACWADAQAQGIAEQSAWPYSWLTTDPTDYPLAAARASVTGKIVIADALKPSVTGAGAWVGLAQPDSGVNWQDEGKRYQYWVQTAADGSFSIPNVRPGTYTFTAFTSGVVGEYSQQVTIAAAGATGMGTVTWAVAHPGASIAWEIGVPDRSAAEFRHGKDYFHGYVWSNFVNEWANPLEYAVGDSNSANDWNYAHCPMLGTDGTSLSDWPWHVHFNLATVPAGSATLTIAYASSNASHMYLYVNNDSKLFRDMGYPAESAGDALLREGIHAKYSYQYQTIATTNLKVGANEIGLLEASTGDAGDHVMYDYLNLEMPTVTGTLSGTVTCQALASSAQPLTFTFVPTGTTGGSTLTVPITPGPDGGFQIGAIPLGTYALKIKGAKYLQRATNVTVVLTPAPVVNINLLVGDVNGDNRVDATDLAAVRALLGTTPSSAKWNANADLNGDGIVNMADLALVRENLNTAGDP